MPRPAGIGSIPTNLQWCTSMTSVKLRPSRSDHEESPMTEDDTSGRVRLRELKTLSDNHYTLRRASFDFQRRDGVWQHQVRESYDIGDAAVVLPLDRARGRVLLIRQFRWPVFEAGYRRTLIEAIAGKLDGDTPEVCIVREAMEEAGITIGNARLVGRCFVSPGAVKERAACFLADYDS